MTKRDIVIETLRTEIELCIPEALHLHSFRKWIYLAGILFIQPWVWRMPDYRVSIMQQFKLRKQMWLCISVCVESQATMKISLGNRYTQTARFTCWYLTVMLQKEIFYWIFFFYFYYLVMLLQINSVSRITIIEFMRIHFISNNCPEVWILICIIQILGSTKWEWERVTSQDFFVLIPYEQTVKNPEERFFSSGISALLSGSLHNVWKLMK